MAGQFSDGFRVGFGAVSSAQRAKREKEEFELTKEKHKRDIDEADLRIQEGRRKADTNRQIDEETAGIRTQISGGFLQGNNGPADESAAAYGVNAGSRVVDPYNPNDPEQQIGLNRRLMSVAALKGDYQNLSAIQDKTREITDMQVFNNAARRAAMDPDSITPTKRFINQNHPLITSEPAKDPNTGQLTGYHVMTVTPSGDAVYKFLSPQQSITAAGAMALFEVNPTKALQILGTVDASLAAAVQQSNTTTKDVTTTRNTAVHYSNQDTTSRMNADSQRIQANAASSNAQTNKERLNKEKPTAAAQAKEKIDMTAEILMRADPRLDRAEAERQAAGIILREPTKDQDAGLAEAGIVKIKGKHYRMGKGDKLEPVQLPAESELDKAIQEERARRAKGQGGGAQAAGLTLHNMSNSELQRIARKPKGVSSAEASAAAEELDLRKRQPRMTSF